MKSLFGYVKPERGELKVCEDRMYQSVYCGICKAQRKYTGLLSCLTLSYDYVFLYLLLAELTGEKTEFAKPPSDREKSGRKCYALPNKALIYTVCVASCFTYLKIEDNIQDEGFFKRLLFKMIKPYASHSLKKAKKHCSILPFEEMKDATKRLSTAEKENLLSADVLADLCSELLSVTAETYIDDDLKKMAARNICRAVARWIYLIDAADDLENDLKKKRFNPFAKEGLDRGYLLPALDSIAEEAEKMLMLVPVYDIGYRHVLYNILRKGLHLTANRVLSKGENSN